MTTHDDRSADPFEEFAVWMDEAEKAEPDDANAMTLATADADGFPSARMVLLKGFDDRGFVFYTNLESDKGRQLAANPKAALCFHWKSLRRQVRVEGIAIPVSDDEADTYFQSRPRESRIGAWASRQSRPLEGRWELERRVAEFAAKFNIGHVPRPPHWSGYRVVPRRIELWRDRPFRLHERRVFVRELMVDSAGGGRPLAGPWSTMTLFP